MTQTHVIQNIAVLLLAAGESKRLGQPKQLIRWKGKYLIESSLEKALSISQNVVIVTGSSRDIIVPIIDVYSAKEVFNPKWHLGMGSSISFGVDYIYSSLPNTKAILVMLVDQPLITTLHYSDLISKCVEYNYMKPIFTDFATYCGVPAILPASLFGDLKKLNANEGAKKILRRLAPNEFEKIKFVGEDLDIDTDDDLDRLHQLK